MSQTRKCKYCKQEINKKAKICPHCQKKQGIDFIWAILIGLIGLGELFSGYIVIGLLFLVIAVFMELPFIKYKLGKNNESDNQTVPQETVQNQTISQNQENTGTEKSEKIRMIRQNLNRQSETQKVITTPIMSFFSVLMHLQGLFNSSADTTAVAPQIMHLTLYCGLLFSVYS